MNIVTDPDLSAAVDEMCRLLEQAQRIAVTLEQENAHLHELLRQIQAGTT